MSAVIARAHRAPRSQRVTIRLYGESIRHVRFQWLAMLDDLRPDCETAQRIREQLATAHAEHLCETLGFSWERAYTLAHQALDA
jgi:hypothetical protein